MLLRDINFRNPIIRKFIAASIFALCMIALIFLVKPTPVLSQSTLRTQLLYRTPSGGAYISNQQSLAIIDVSQYSQIRVIANVNGNVNITLTEYESGQYIVSMDRVNVTDTNFLSKVYDVPGKQLVVIANASQGTARLFLDIYGR